MLPSLKEPKRILLAEDCPDTQKILQMMLEQTGAEIILADNGKECVDRLFNEEQAPIDMVVLDIKMPVMDGLEALSTLRTKGCELPTVMLTASPSEESQEKADSLGCKAFLSKLTDRSHIIPTIKKILDEGAPKKRVSLPVLPVYPETMPQDIESFDAVLAFLDRTDGTLEAFRVSLDQHDYDALEDHLVKLGVASFYGYNNLAKQLEFLREALEEKDRNKVMSRGASIERTLAGMREGRAKIRAQADELRSATTST